MNAYELGRTVSKQAGSRWREAGNLVQLLLRHGRTLPPHEALQRYGNLESRLSALAQAQRVLDPAATPLAGYTQRLNRFPLQAVAPIARGPAPTQLVRGIRDLSEARQSRMFQNILHATPHPEVARDYGARLGQNRLVANYQASPHQRYFPDWGIEGGGLLGRPWSRAQRKGLAHTYETPVMPQQLTSYGLLDQSAASMRVLPPTPASESFLRQVAQPLFKSTLPQPARPPRAQLPRGRLPIPQQYPHAWGVGKAIGATAGLGGAAAGAYALGRQH